MDGKEYEVGTPSQLLSAMSGTSLDWAQSMDIKYSYLIKLRGYYHFVLPSEFIEPSAKEARTVTFVVARNVADITDVGEAPTSNTQKLFNWLKCLWQHLIVNGFVRFGCFV